jgi:hypothetical protein
MMFIKVHPSKSSLTEIWNVDPNFQFYNSIIIHLQRHAHTNITLAAYLDSLIAEINGLRTYSLIWTKIQKFLFCWCQCQYKLVCIDQIAAKVVNTWTSIGLVRIRRARASICRGNVALNITVCRSGLMFSIILITCGNREYQSYCRSCIIKEGGKGTTCSVSHYCVRSQMCSTP